MSSYSQKESKSYIGKPSSPYKLAHRYHRRSRSRSRSPRSLRSSYEGRRRQRTPIREIQGSKSTLGSSNPHQNSNLKTPTEQNDFLKSLVSTLDVSNLLLVSPPLNPIFELYRQEMKWLKSVSFLFECSSDLEQKQKTIVSSLHKND